MTPDDVLALAGRLSGEARPYALATVVRVERPASASPGDHAVVTPDGELSGWVGGACSEPTVIREALGALADGEARLVRIAPAGHGGAAPAGMVVAESACASEGVVEVMVEPRMPSPLLAVAGATPVAETLRSLARRIGWRVTETAGGADAAVVATMGHGDEDAVAEALEATQGYVGLVASGRRGAVVRDALAARGVDAAALERLRSPAGLDLGRCTQAEIAVAILAELVVWHHEWPGPHIPQTAVAAAAAVAEHACDHCHD